MALYISIPGFRETTPKGDIIKVKTLGIEVSVTSSDDTLKTLKDALKKEIGMSLTSASLAPSKPYRSVDINPNVEHFLLECKNWSELLDIVLKREPLVETMEKQRRAKKSSHLTDLSPEEVLDYGYPDFLREE